MNDLLEDILHNLSVLGLTEKEAKAYTTLLLQGELKAKEIADLSGLKRTETYEVLRELQSKALVEVTLSKPMAFTAVPLEKGLSLLTRDLRNRLQMVEQARASLLEEWAKEKSQPSLLKTTMRIQIIEGFRQILKKIETIWNSAEKEILIQMDNKYLVRGHVLGVFDGLKDLPKLEKEVNLITEVKDEKTYELVKSFNFPVRCSPTIIQTQLTIVDQRETLIHFPTKDVGLWTNSSDITQALRNYFNDQWNNSLTLNQVWLDLMAGKSK